MNRSELQGWCQDAADELNEIYELLEDGALDDHFIAELSMLRALCQDILTEGREIKYELFERDRISSCDEVSEHAMDIREFI